MESLTVSVICATAFGDNAELASFIKQLQRERSKSLNDEAQQAALAEKLSKVETLHSRELKNHYQNLLAQVQETNKDYFKPSTEINESQCQAELKIREEILQAEKELDDKVIAYEPSFPGSLNKFG